YYLTIHSMSKLLRLRDHRMFSFFILPVVFVMAMVPLNIIHMYEIIRNVGRTGLIITIVYPALLLMLSFVRKKRGEPVEQKSMDPGS
ncbi:MAG: spore germination protein, partial [Paenibacillus sp.]|nr:spore germination protein [Paenibacillus sp.]